MRLVILESPYAGDVASNEAYARACIRDCLLRGESPIASHLLFTQPGVLRDDVPDDRKLGIAAGHAWYRVAEACVVYVDRGISPGMEAGIAAAKVACVANGCLIRSWTDCWGGLRLLRFKARDQTYYKTNRVKPMTIETLAQIKAPHFVAGIVLRGDHVVSAAHIIRYMEKKRWTRDQVREYCASKGWTVSVVSEETV